MKVPKELIKEYVKSEKFTNTTDIMESIKSLFADVYNEDTTLKGITVTPGEFSSSGELIFDMNNSILNLGEYEKLFIWTDNNKPVMSSDILSSTPIS